MKNMEQPNPKTRIKRKQNKKRWKKKITLIMKYQKKGKELE